MHHFKCIFLFSHPAPGYSDLNHPLEPLLDFSVPSAPDASPQRPGIVSAISIYQFLRAIYLVFVFFWVGVKSELPFVHGGPFSHSTANLIMLVVGIAAVFIGVVANGLWNLQSWARHAMLPQWGMAFWFASRGGVRMQAELYRSVVPATLVGVLLLLDLLSYLSLVLYPEIARTFNDREIGLFDR